MMDQAFVRWVTDHAQELLTQPPIELRQGPGYRVAVQYRSGRRQVESIVMDPHTCVTPHRHPHINAAEFYQGGDFVLIVGTHRFHAHPGLKPHRRLIPVRASDWHAAEVGPAGAQFLSIQEWSGEGRVTSALEDWEGQEEKVTIDANH